MCLDVFIFAALRLAALTAVQHAASGRGAVVFGGHTAVIGWLRSRSDVFHRDVALLSLSGASASMYTLI